MLHQSLAVDSIRERRLARLRLHKSKSAMLCASLIAAVVCGLSPTTVSGQQRSVPSQGTLVPPPDTQVPESKLLSETESQPRLGLADLEQMALVANPSITRASALVGAAHGNWVQVGLRPNPSVGYDGQQIGSGGLAEQHGIMFNQEFVRGGKLRLNRAVAQRELARAEQELALASQKVLTDVRISFYQVLLAQRQIELTTTLVKISNQGATAVDNLFKRKEVSRADVLQSQLEVENAQVLATNARNRHDSAWRSLRAVVGNPQLPALTLDGDAFAPPREFDFQETLASIQTGSPEISVAMTEVSRARSTLDRAQVERVSNLTFQGLLNVRDNGARGRTDAGIALSMPIPVFNRNQGGIVKAQHEIVAAERALQQVELGLESRLAQIFERYANARNQVERYRDAILPAAEESLELTRKMYEAGEVGYIALLTAQRTYSQTNLNYLDALRELRITEVQIDGQLLRDSLNTGNSP